MEWGYRDLLDEILKPFEDKKDDLNQQNVVEKITLVEMYCGNCNTHVYHRYVGNFKDGSRILGRYICKDCGTEKEGAPMVEFMPNTSQ